MSEKLPTPPQGKPATRARGAWARRVLWVAGAVLALLIAIGLWPGPVEVEVAAVSRGPLTVTVNEEGMTRVKNRYVVSAPVGGQLRRIDLKAGAAVVAGQTALAMLDNAGADLLDARSERQAQARVQAAIAARDAAQAQADSATASARTYATEQARLRRLFDQGLVAQQEMDMAQLRADTAVQDQRAAAFSLQVAEYELEQARALLMRGQPDPGTGYSEPLVITSPVDGRVLRVMQESARVVPAGLALMEVGDAQDLEARIEVLSRDAVMIEPGARVELDKWGGVEPLNGRVRVVEPSAFTKISALGVEEQRVYVVVDITDPASERSTLGDAYRVEARIVTWESDAVLKVPTGALFQRGDTWQTYVMDGGRAWLRQVEVDHSNGTETEILSGLEEGESVVVYPSDRVEDGVRIAPIEVNGR